MEDVRPLMGDEQFQWAMDFARAEARFGYHCGLGLGLLVGAVLGTVAGLWLAFLGR